ncbi:Predicted nucleic acid-binding protein, contains PIN domain [Arthrobacter sp. 31Cvi3.1E]|nr:Predicted nucleic acid-binding protein, contains PIN domain [Arthrobacter sp. 31Cvi3.1E]
MDVILDSTALIADFHLSAPSSRSLLERAKSGFIWLAVPELVLLEVVSKRRIRAEEIARAVDAVRKSAKRLCLVGVNVSTTSMDDETAAYKRTLREKLQTANALILASRPLPMSTSSAWQSNDSPLY